MSWRPWTESAKRLRYMKGVKRKFPEPLKKWNIVRGDTVSDLVAAVGLQSIFPNGSHLKPGESP